MIIFFQTYFCAELTPMLVIYFFFPETARLTLEEIAQNFGEEVAVHITDAADEERGQLEQQLEATDTSKEANVNEASSPKSN